MKKLLMFVLMILGVGGLSSSQKFGCGAAKNASSFKCSSSSSGYCKSPNVSLFIPIHESSIYCSPAPERAPSGDYWKSCKCTISQDHKNVKCFCNMPDATSGKVWFSNQTLVKQSNGQWKKTTGKSFVGRNGSSWKNNNGDLEPIIMKKQ